jgi:hypothetical protein
MLRDKFKLSQPRAEILYSVAVAVVIPLLVIVGAFVVSRSVRHDFETEQQHKVEAISTVITQAITENVDKRGVLQQQILKYKVTPEISELTIVRNSPYARKYIVTESTSQDKIAQTIEDVSYDLAISSKQNVKQLVNDGNGRSWRIVAPIEKDGRIVAIFSLSVSLLSADNLTHSTLVKSFLIGSGVVVAIVLLLINDTLFLEHALLPRRARDEDKSE